MAEELVTTLPQIQSIGQDHYVKEIQKLKKLYMEVQMENESMSKNLNNEKLKRKENWDKYIQQRRVTSELLQRISLLEDKIIETAEVARKQCMYKNIVQIHLTNVKYYKFSNSKFTLHFIS